MNIVSRVYVQVHNKGTEWAHRVRTALRAIRSQQDEGLADIAIT